MIVEWRRLALSFIRVFFLHSFSQMIKRNSNSAKKKKKKKKEKKNDIFSALDAIGPKPVENRERGPWFGRMPEKPKGKIY